MKTGMILRRIAMLLSLVMLITSTLGTTYGFIVTSTDPITNIFVPDDVKVNGLAISKAVEHPLGQDYMIPDHITFDFQVELGSYYANAKLNTTVGEMTADANGTLNVSVKPGVTFGIEGLKEGTTVQVTEQTTTLAGFAVKGEATKTVTVGADGTASVAFVNVYAPDAVKPGNVTVSGIKVLEGREWQTGDTFTFVLEQKDGDAWTKLGEQTVTYDAQNADFNEFDFNEIFQALTFDKVGTYTFRMSEVIGNLENVDYDKTLNHFTVLVTDVDMDGKLEIHTVAGTENAKVTEMNGAYAVAVTFNNAFVPPVVPDPEPVTVQIGIDKTLEIKGELTHGLGGFEFVLENVATSERLTATSDDKGKASFTLTFDKDDVGKTYTYKLSETNHGFYGMTYDGDVYEIAVRVTLNEEHKLIAACTMNGKPVDTLNAAFQNIYDADRTTVPPTGDTSNLTVWFIMMLVSASAFVALVVYDRKRRPA